MDHSISLYHVVLGLRDLLDKRHGDLLKSKAGQYYDAQLKNQLQRFDTLPPALTGTPFAGSLKEEDKGHDGYGGSFVYTWPQRGLTMVGTVNQTDVDWWPLALATIRAADAL